MLELISGKKTYLVVIAAIAYIVGGKLKLWTVDLQVLAGMGALIAAFLRAGVQKAHDAIDDKGPVLTAQNGTPRLTILALTLGTLLAVGATTTGCRLLSPAAPGQDPLVVHVEQVQAISFTTLDTLLKIDDGARDFFRTNLPPFHAFAEYLRQPVPDGTNQIRRWVSYLETVDRIKLSYLHGLTSSNNLITALAVLESTTAEAQKQIANAQAH